MLTPQPRSVRNNNPGNLRCGIQWFGLSENQTDPDFCIFQNARFGFRALGIDLHTKWFADGLHTVGAIISKYAPEPENDTAAYIEAVCSMMGKEHTDWLNLDDAAELTALARAIAVCEAGGWYFEQADLDAGITMVFVQAKRKPEPRIA